MIAPKERMSEDSSNFYACARIANRNAKVIQMLNKDTKVQSKHGPVLTRRIARVAVRRVIHINVRTYLLKSPSIWNGAAHYKVYGGWPNIDNNAARSAGRRVSTQGRR